MAQIDATSSYISYDHKPLSEKYAGIVFILTNDHHAEGGRWSLSDYGLDAKNMNKFFDNLVDEYYKTTASCATYNRFVATCMYLADPGASPGTALPKEFVYPESCKRIIIYFAGHGSNGYICMEEDKKHPKQPRNVKISDILSYFRNDKCKDMEKILLLDSCCNIENIECQNNELVACATSQNKPAQSLANTGGFWTKTILDLFNQSTTYTLNLVTLLKDVRDYMIGEGRMAQIPGFKNGIQGEIIFTKCMLSYN